MPFTDSPPQHTHCVLERILWKNDYTESTRLIELCVIPVCVCVLLQAFTNCFILTWDVTRPCKLDTLFTQYE